MSDLRPCKHLDYEGDYTDCVVKTMAPHYPDVRYWERGACWTDNGPGEKPNPKNVQFCGEGRGRINAVFDCYDGSMGSCYEAVEPLPAEAETICRAVRGTVRLAQADGGE